MVTDGLSLMSTPDSCSRKTLHWGEVPHLFSSSLYSLSSWVSVLSGCPLNTPGQHLNIYPRLTLRKWTKRSTAKNQCFGGGQYWEPYRVLRPLWTTEAIQFPAISAPRSFQRSHWPAWIGTLHHLELWQGRWDVLTQTLLTVALRRSGSPCSSKYDHIYIVLYIWSYIYNHLIIYYLYWILSNWLFLQQTHMIYSCSLDFLGASKCTKPKLQVLGEALDAGATCAAFVSFLLRFFYGILRPRAHPASMTIPPKQIS